MQIIKESEGNYLHDDIEVYGNIARKGGLGNLLEERYFGLGINILSEADFIDAGVELKVSPYEITKTKKFRAGERLVLGMISNTTPVEFDFLNSQFWRKNSLILLVYYLRDRSLQNNLLYKIDYVKLFTPPKKDLKIIMEDYKKIVNKIASGRAHELSESDTMYLGACTKGSTAKKSTVPQFYPPYIPARRRAFCYKNSYMNYVLNNYIMKDIDTYEPIIKDEKQLESTTFEEYIINKINNYAGKTDKELCNIFSREYNNNKSQWIDLAYRMLGIKSNAAQEFIKANIVVKAIRLEENGSMRESSSLPPFQAKKLIEEDWEDSVLYNYFEETKFLFVIYKKLGDLYILKGSQLWNMPYQDLNTYVKEGWVNVRNKIKNGLIFTKIGSKDNFKIINNLPKKNDNPVIHIRPHAAKRFYILSSGELIGPGSYSDGDELPDGRWMTRQSFWLNNNYILNQLEDHFK